jgi:hypothetical protein
MVSFLSLPLPPLLCNVVRSKYFPSSPQHGRGDKKFGRLQTRSEARRQSRLPPEGGQRGGEGILFSLDLWNSSTFLFEPLVFPLLLVFFFAALPSSLT